MEHKDVEAEIQKKCEKCGFDDLPHCVVHRPEKVLFMRYGNPHYRPEAMVFICTRCGYEWEIEIE